MNRYDEETQQAALDCLAANEGDYNTTSEATGVPVKTLRRWAAQDHDDVSPDSLAQLHDELAAIKARLQTQQAAAEGGGDDLKVWLHDRLLPHLIDDAMALSDSIKDVIADATLSQRAGALNQVLDKIFKISQLYPANEEYVLRVEYVDPDGTTHDTPYWARKDSDE